MSTTAQRLLRLERMGRIGYAPMLALQERRHDEVAEARADDTLFLLEHEAVITLGKNSGDGHVLASRELLAAAGVELFATSRGGDVTYHGPGQIVGYPILQLQEGERDIKHYVHRLEEILIRACADYDIRAERVEGLRGVWVGREKIGAIGVRIARWATLHGFALNVSPDLDAFRLIVPCGLRDKGVTSMAKLLGAAPPLTEVEERLAHHAGEVLDRRLLEVTPVLQPHAALGAPGVSP